MKRKILYIIFILFFYWFPIKAQILYRSTDSSIVNFTIEMVVIDSQYYLIPQLIIKKKGMKIKIPEKRVYVDGISITDYSNAKIYLQKVISKTPTFITLGSTEEFFQSKKYTKYVDFKSGDLLMDTINLQNRYPIEQGEYKVELQLDYYHGKKKITIVSSLLSFSVFYIPKNARW